MKYFCIEQKFFVLKFIETYNPAASRASYETPRISGSNVREIYPAWDLAVDFHARGDARAEKKMRCSVLLWKKETAAISASKIFLARLFTCR